MKKKKIIEHIIGTTILEVFLIIASLFIFIPTDFPQLFQVNIERINYTIIGIALIVVIIIARLGLEDYLRKN